MHETSKLVELNKLMLAKFLLDDKLKKLQNESNEDKSVSLSTVGIYTNTNLKLLKL